MVPEDFPRRLRAYLLALREVETAVGAHDSAWAAYTVKRGLFTPEAAPETKETTALLITASDRRMDLDRAKEQARRAWALLSDDEYKFVFGLLDLEHGPGVQALWPARRSNWRLPSCWPARPKMSPWRR